MQEKVDESSRIEFTPKLFALTELGFGILIVIFSAYGIFPLFVLWLAGVIVIVVVFPLLLYMAIAMIFGRCITWEYDSKPVYVIASMLVLSIWVVFPFFGEIAAAISSMFCGILVILLSAWHFRIQV